MRFISSPAHSRGSTCRTCCLYYVWLSSCADIPVKQRLVSWLRFRMSTESSPRELIPSCDFHTVLKPQLLIHYRRTVLQRLGSQYPLGSCCLKPVWREAFEVIAVLLLCGSNNFYRLSAQGHKESFSINNALPFTLRWSQPLWEICGQIRSQTCSPPLLCPLT